MRFAQIHAKRKQSAKARKEWWHHSRRLSPDTLICLLSSEGLATFFVVASQGQKPTQLQSEYDLASNPEHAYVVGKPLDRVAFHGVLSGALTSTSYMQLSLVESPGILLPAFEPILEAIQRVNENLDMPFPHILALNPASKNSEREIHVEPPAYATKPGFKFDLSRITATRLYVLLQTAS
jgi:hypothetical protein